MKTHFLDSSQLIYSQTLVQTIANCGLATVLFWQKNMSKNWLLLRNEGVSVHKLQVIFVVIHEINCDTFTSSLLTLYYKNAGTYNRVLRVVILFDDFG